VAFIKVGGTWLADGTALGNHFWAERPQKMVDWSTSMEIKDDYSQKSTQCFDCIDLLQRAKFLVKFFLQKIFKQCSSGVQKLFKHGSQKCSGTPQKCLIL
jgi:hypothetical protein